MTVAKRALNVLASGAFCLLAMFLGMNLFAALVIVVCYMGKWTYEFWSWVLP